MAQLCCLVTNLHSICQIPHHSSAEVEPKDEAWSTHTQEIQLQLIFQMDCFYLSHAKLSAAKHPPLPPNNSTNTHPPPASCTCKSNCHTAPLNLNPANHISIAGARHSLCPSSQAQCQRGQTHALAPSSGTPRQRPMANKAGKSFAALQQTQKAGSTELPLTTCSMRGLGAGRVSE
jgi:hypothetical protein